MSRETSKQAWHLKIQMRKIIFERPSFYCTLLLSKRLSLDNIDLHLICWWNLDGFKGNLPAKTAKPTWHLNDVQTVSVERCRAQRLKAQSSTRLSEAKASGTLGPLVGWFHRGFPGKSKWTPRFAWEKKTNHWRLLENPPLKPRLHGNGGIYKRSIFQGWTVELNRKVLGFFLSDGWS